MTREREIMANGARPAFIVTVDTEGDDLWSCPQSPTTRNSAFLGRFQQLCEHHGFKPTYLVDHEMAHCPVFGELAADVVRRGAAEIGMHLHAATSPPPRALAGPDPSPFLCEYPEAVMREKIVAQTDLIEERFGVRPVSHRGGRWSFDEVYARILVELGYRTDCSVTPGVDWHAVLDRPGAAGVPDYRGFPLSSYFLDPDDISRAGDSALLEVPMTVAARDSAVLDRTRRRLVRGSYGRRILDRLAPATTWLRPSGRNLRTMLQLVDSAQVARAGYAQFMIHSSELMPGGSPLFPTGASIEALYADLETLFATLSERFVGATLEEWRERVTSENPGRVAASPGSGIAGGTGQLAEAQ